MNVMPVELYSDGSCLGNPGPGGIGYIIRYWELLENANEPQVKQIEGSQGYKHTTNNRMEILSACIGLENIVANAGNGTFKNVTMIILKSDSKYVCDAISKRWIDKWQQNNWVTMAQTPVKNRDLWERVVKVKEALSNSGITLNIEHIPGHAGHEFNEAADKLATTASGDTTNHIVDDAYENSRKKRW